MHKPDNLLMIAINSCLVLALFNTSKNYQTELDWKKQKTTESNLSRIEIYWNEFVAKLTIKKKKLRARRDYIAEKHATLKLRSETDRSPFLDMAATEHRCHCPFQYCCLCLD